MLDARPQNKPKEKLTLSENVDLATTIDFRKGKLGSRTVEFIQMNKFVCPCARRQSPGKVALELTRRNWDGLLIVLVEPVCRG